MNTYEKQGILTKKSENNHCSTYKITKKPNNTKNTEPTTNYLYNFSETNTHPNNPQTEKLINQLNTKNKGGEALDSQTRVNMENGLDYNFGSVKIHTDNYATNLTKALNSKATCYGEDIYFAKNQYNPNTKQGTNLLKHELNHYQQQTITGTKQIQNQENDGSVQQIEETQESSDTKDATPTNDAILLSDDDIKKMALSASIKFLKETSTIDPLKLIFAKPPTTPQTQTPTTPTLFPAVASFANGGYNRFITPSYVIGSDARHIELGFRLLDPSKLFSKNSNYVLSPYVKGIFGSQAISAELGIRADLLSLDVKNMDISFAPKIEAKAMLRLNDYPVTLDIIFKSTIPSGNNNVGSWGLQLGITYKW